MKSASKVNVWEGCKNEYVSPKGFRNWCEVIERYVSTANECDKYELHQEGLTCRLFLTSRAPTKFISKELIESFLETDFPYDVSDEVTKVLPCFNLMVPKGSLVLGDSLDVSSILVNASCASYKRFEVVALCDGDLLHTTIDPKAGHYDEGFFDWAAPTLKTSIDEKLARVAINAMLILASESEVVMIEGDEVPTNLTKEGDGKVRAPSTPWLGRGVRYVRSNASTSSGKGCGKIRPHWRKGHWHTVRCGKNKEDKKKIWIKPVFVKGNNPESDPE